MKEGIGVDEDAILFSAACCIGQIRSQTSIIFIHNEHRRRICFMYRVLQCGSYILQSQGSPVRSVEGSLTHFIHCMPQHHHLIINCG